MAAAHPKVSIFCSGLLLLLSFWISPIADAAKIFVPQDIASIQEAIDTSVEGDEIIVSPGDWIGPFDFQSARLLSSHSTQHDLPHHPMS